MEASGWPLDGSGKALENFELGKALQNIESVLNRVAMAPPFGVKLCEDVATHPRMPVD